METFAVHIGDFNFSIWATSIFQSRRLQHPFMWRALSMLYDSVRSNTLMSKLVAIPWLPTSNNADIEKQIKCELWISKQTLKLGYWRCGKIR